MADDQPNQQWQDHKRGEIKHRLPSDSPLLYRSGTDAMAGEWAGEYDEDWQPDTTDEVNE